MLRIRGGGVAAPAKWYKVVNLRSSQGGLPEVSFFLTQWLALRSNEIRIEKCAVTLLKWCDQVINMF